MNSVPDPFALPLCIIALPLGWFVALFKFTMSPLGIPLRAKSNSEREANLLAAILLIVFGGILGIIIVYGVIVGTLVREHLKQRRLENMGATMQPESSMPFAPRSPVIPRIALVELLGMVLGIATFPIMVFGTDFQSGKGYSFVFMMVMGALLYPLCVLAAYNRVDARNVPVGGARTAYVALFPLMLFACVFQPGILIIMQANGVNSAPYLQLGLGTCVVLAETIASAKASAAQTVPHDSQTTVAR